MVYSVDIVYTVEMVATAEMVNTVEGTRGATVPKIHPFCCGHPSLTETLFK